MAIVAICCCVTEDNAFLFLNFCAHAHLNRETPKADSRQAASLERGRKVVLPLIHTACASTSCAAFTTHCTVSQRMFGGGGWDPPEIVVAH